MIASFLHGSGEGVRVFTGGAGHKKRERKQRR